MVYAGDQWVQLPVRDLYDTQMMAMAINAAKDMYEKGEKRLDDFYTKYGDFTSPIQKDMDAYNNIIGGVRDKINQLYAAGIDPLRSAEGRAAVAQLTRSIPVGDIAKLRQSAEAAKEYIKNRGVLEASGKWDPNFERFANNGVLLEDWDTLGGGIWNRTSPAELKTLKDVTEEWYNQRTPHMLSKEDVESFGLKYDPKYNYKGFTENDLLNIAAGQTPGWNGSIYADYYRDVARRKVQAMKNATGDANPVTSGEIERQLQKDIAVANREYLIAPEKEADQFALDDYRTANDIRAHSKKKAIDYYYNHKDDGDQTQTGWNIPEDVYLTSLAKGAGIEYLPKGGVSPNQLQKMIKVAAERQNAAILNTRNVLSATGMFISPEKIAGLIQADGKDGNGYFLNPNYFKNIHDLQDVRTSYKGWRKRGTTAEQSKLIRKGNKQRSKSMVSGIEQWLEKSGNEQYKLKVVPVTDENGNNTYNMVGDDNRWHTYALVRAYMSDGKQTKDGGKATTINGKQKHDIPKEGTLMVLDVGLKSNIGTGTPDLSVSERENLGFYGFDATKQKIGLNGNSGFPYGTNILLHQMDGWNNIISK